MCELSICSDFLALLQSCDQRLISHKKNDHNNLRDLTKSEVETILSYILWPQSQRQCMCGYRDLKNFDRFNYIIRSLIYLIVTKLKDIKNIIANSKTSDENPANAQQQQNPQLPQQLPTKEINEIDKEKEVQKQQQIEEPKKETDEMSKEKTSETKNIINVTAGPTKASEEIWTVPELEKVLIFISKVFLLNFPLYIAHKHGVHYGHESSQQEIQSVSMFCDIHDTEIPVYLYHNVTLFCSSGGFNAMTHCFEIFDLPLSLAHACTVAISNIKLWLNYRSIVQLFVPLRIKVLQYMCKLSDQELRSPATKSMADFMWSAIKDPLDSQLTFDTEGLALAFKYFTSSTLTMRLAGMSQINAHINWFNDICTTETVAEVELVGRKLADWLTENQIISHLFGPNLHAEIIKQSHIVLNFLAVENHITEEHVSLIWQASQLKHCSKPIYDILPALVKNLAPKPASYLYSLLCKLDPKEHTEQTIFIISALTKLIWTRDRNRHVISSEASSNVREITEIPSSSENSVSVDGSNSEEDHRHDPEDDSSDECHKSPIEVESDSGPPPCKQPRGNLASLRKKVCEGKIQQEMYAIEKEKKPIYPIIGHRISSYNVQNSSSDDERININEKVINDRKKLRKKRKKHLSRKEIQEMVESISDGDSDCDQLFGGSDCSEGIHDDVLDRLNKDESFFRAISENCHLMDYLRSTENDGSSSPMSTKSEKNLADFDDEESPCEELTALATKQNACFSFSRENRSNTPDNLHNKQIKQVSESSGEKNKSGTSSLSSSMRTKSPDICQPGNTLLWDLLQDDKIGFLGESLALETEKTLSSLVCFHTDKTIRKKFIEACLVNIANNRSVIVSLRLIPKLLASFQQFRDIGTHQVTMWAERQHKMMHHFFNNLKYYCNSVKHSRNRDKAESGDEPSLILVKNKNGDYLYSHTTQIQVRLQFLASLFCDIGSPKTFRLTINQVDILWSCLANDPDCADCLFHWLQGQAKGGAQHALSSIAIQHIYRNKWPELKPENISMVALTLFQQLFILTLSDERRNSERSEVSGMDILWKIALRANDTEVSMASINYINTFYMEHQLKNEAEFVKQCMNYLTQASENLHKPELQDNSIMCVQRALMLLNTHLETFRRRYAYHLRRWALEGKGITSHSALRTEGPGPPIKIILQPGGLSEKSYLHLYQTDLIGDLKAEIAKWYENLQGKSCSSDSLTIGGQGNVLTDGPLRIITQGQEITSEYDERSLIDVGFKDNQIVYVSLGGRSRGRRNEDHPSMLPPPSKDCLPTILLLQTQYFEQLFVLMQTLGNMKLIKKGVNFLQHTQAQVLSRRVWDILAMLPTNPTLLDTFKNLTFNQKTSMTEDDKVSIQDLLDPSNLQKFMYCLHIVESLSKSRFSSSIKPSSHQRNQLKMKITKGKNAKKAAIVKENVEETKNTNSQETPEKSKDQSADNESTDNAPHTQKNDESSIDAKIKKSIEWSNKFIKNGGLEHLYNIFISGVLQKNDDEYDEWRHDCLCSLLRILCLLGVEDLKQEENIIVIPKLNEDMLKLMEVKKTISRISSILNEAAVPQKDNHYKTGFWGRAQVVNFSMNLLVCFAYSSEKAREILWSCEENYEWLKKLILDDPDPHVRRETCAALYRLCMGNSHTHSELIVPLLVLLISFLPTAEKMRTQTICYSLNDDGKELYGQACRDYFWLLSRLVDNTTPDLLKGNITEVQNNLTIDVEALCHQVSKLIINRDILERRHIQDDGLVGLLNLMANLVKYDPPFKYSQSGQQFIGKIFECLFALPTAENRDLPKCKSQGARAASYDLLIELTKNAPSNYMLLHKMLMLQHRPGPHSPYAWDYWPRDDGRSESGYVGLTNLGATCYMAACIQHIFMMPQARETILSVPADAPVKHKLTFCELQKMFAYLMESERKSYNPRSFCKVYQMDHQPLNTGEQKDMAEFFIDLVSKLEEMTPELKSLVKRIFCGVISNNVVSLDCDHVSRTLEEFYTVRCQVADMRNLQESLDEVTVKDTLEGDNMYTCSTCSKKVRAEKRACFKKLPQILCFNTMRYTFNMVTMLKEKVNTHFSFPMRLDMSRYVEKTLMPQHYQEERLKTTSESSDKIDNEENIENPIKEDEMHKINVEKENESENYEYDLVGVTVHTGTADGGHYYSFIKERDSDRKSQSDRWFLFNDAEVKIFDPSQIAAECFGGEMTSKTYDSVTEKYLDFSFEKTNSAYMLFYERRPTQDEQFNNCLINTPGCSTRNSEFVPFVDEDNPLDENNLSIKENQQKNDKSKQKTLLSKELEDWIWQDNRHYLEDRNIFEHTYFNFMWQICGHVPQSLLVLNDITFRAAQLSVSFFIETFIHAKEKPTMVLWVELLTKQFNASQEACEWFLNHMSQEPWWPVQVLIQCPNQMVRQMFQRLVIHVIQRLRQAHSSMYLEKETEDTDDETIGEKSCVTKFIKSLIALMENGAKAHLRHLTEFFGLLYEFSRMGEEETKFLLHINVIKSVSDFYLGHKNHNNVDSSSSDNSSDETLSIDKTRPASLDKMIALVANLVEKSRGADQTLQLSTRDYNAITGGKGFPFLYQQIKDNINPNQTRLLIHALCRYDERLAGSIITMLFSAVTKHTELCSPFFKLLTLLTESSSGPSGLPCFSQLVLQRVWDAAEFCPQPALEWLAMQAPRNKIAHAWVLSTAESWVENFLIASSNLRVRNAAANLVVSLVPVQSFRQNFRATSHHKIVIHNPLREISSGEAQTILHSILNILLKLLRSAKNYTDISTHGTVKLTSYFSLLTYCMITKTEKLMLGPHIKTLWELFHPKLSEPSVPTHHNKQALLAFWYHATVDCPENAQIVANNVEITKNIAFNYILADHDDSEVVQYNRCMLPAYYGLLRLCCEQSRTLTRQLAGHQNLQWAFKNITPYPTQYPLAVDELFKLMQLFVAKHSDSNQTELDQISIFRRHTLSAYLSSLDARVSWNTLISALKILIENDDDRVFFVSNGGLFICFEAFLTLHSMYHEATACNVIEDLQDLLREIVRLIQALRHNCRDQKKRHPQSGYFKGLAEVVRRLTTLLNTFNPSDMRKLTLDILKELVKSVPNEVISILTPILVHCHTQQQHSGPIGSYLPRRNSKNAGAPNNSSLSWSSKNIQRPPRPLIQMNIPRTLQSSFSHAKGIDKEFDIAVENFYKPYHEFLDVFFRAAVSCNSFNDTLTNLSLQTAIEAIGWHFTLFPAFWVGLAKNKTMQKYVDMLLNNNMIHEYIDRILKDERISLNDSMIANFVEIFYGKVRTRMSITKLLDNICANLTKKEWEELCGDLHAIRIIGQTSGFPQGSKNNIKQNLQLVLQKCKDFVSNEEESPPKKPKLDIQTSESEHPKTNSDSENVIEISPNVTKTVDSQEPQQCSSSASPTYSARNDLIRDIESLIEIIFECFDHDDSITATTAGATLTTNSSKPPELSSADSSNENATSSEVSHEMDKTISSEKTEGDTENEKKNESSSD